MYEAKVSFEPTTAGNCYEVPVGIDDKKFNELIYEFVNIAKTKGLTVRQAQYLFKACSDYVLENKLS